MKNKIDNYKINESIKSIKEHSDKVNSINLKALIVTTMAVIKINELAMEEIRDEIKTEELKKNPNLLKINYTK